MTSRGAATRRRSYEDWIAGYVAGRAGVLLGRCREASEAMLARFPTELRLVRGHVECPRPWGRRAHWWLVDPDGEIVDPTAGQFELGILRYDEYAEGDDLRLGRCMHCGSEIWGPPHSRTRIDTQFCDEACRHDFGRALATREDFEDAPAFGLDAPVAILPHRRRR